METKELENIANRLGSLTPQTEIIRRTMIGRLYYCVYHDVKDWLEKTFKDEFKNTYGSSHDKLSNCCRELERQYSDIQLKELGNLVRDLKNYRVHADYFLKKPFKTFEVEKAKLKFNAIYALLNELKTKYS